MGNSILKFLNFNVRKGNRLRDSKAKWREKLAGLESCVQ